MKLTSYTIHFKGGSITVRAFNYEEAKILAQAEAIKRCWDYTILSPSTKRKTYRIYYKKFGEYQKTDEVFDIEFDASQRCFWLNENTIEGAFGTFYYEEEAK